MNGYFAEAGIFLINVVFGFYILMVFLSTVVVAMGLLKNSVAVIIGGMVIAPFLSMKLKRYRASSYTSPSLYRYWIASV